MSKVRIEATAYVEGTLPDVCVVSGRPTTDRVRWTSRLDEHARGRGVVASLRRFIDRFGDIRPDGPPPRLVIKGEVPMLPEEAQRFATDRRRARLMAWMCVAVLMVAAWAGAPWSPVVAAVSAVGLVVAWAWMVKRWRRRPVADIDAAGRWVTLYRVHPTFVTAVAGHGTADDKEA